MSSFERLCRLGLALSDFFFPLTSCCLSLSCSSFYTPSHLHSHLALNSLHFTLPIPTNNNNKTSRFQPTHTLSLTLSFHCTRVTALNRFLSRLDFLVLFCPLHTHRPVFSFFFILFFFSSRMVTHTPIRSPLLSLSPSTHTYTHILSQSLGWPYFALLMADG